MRKWLAKWLLKSIRDEQLGAVNSIGLEIAQEADNAPPKMRFAIRQAINGKFIEVSTHKPQHRGSDWVTEYYIVPEGKKVSEALTMLMLLKGADD